MHVAVLAPLSSSVIILETSVVKYRGYEIWAGVNRSLMALALLHSKP